MFVVKRDGRKEDVKFDKITSRINKLCYGLDNRFVDSVKISQKVGRVLCRGSYSPFTVSLLLRVCLFACLPVLSCLPLCVCLCLSRVFSVGLPASLSGVLSLMFVSLSTYITSSFSPSVSFFAARPLTAQQRKS